MIINKRPQDVVLRRPGSLDGAALHGLIQSCHPLDENSMYCNLLQCTHFLETSVVGEQRGELVCAISGYIVPGRENTLFIWQVAVSESVRGQGLGGRMLEHILERPACSDVTHLETTVTPSNAASWAMFEGLARRRGAAIQRSPIFERARHFSGAHETEILARIGPLSDDRDNVVRPHPTHHRARKLA